MSEMYSQLRLFLPTEVRMRYEILNFRNAAQILSTSAKEEHHDLMLVLQSFTLSIDDIRRPGGNESDIPKRLSEMLVPRGWNETQIKGDLHISKFISSRKSKRNKNALSPKDGEIVNTDAEPMGPVGPAETIIRRNYLDGHKVDFIKGRVAFDLEWNSKDQTFDRDLYAFRTFYECDLIDVAVILTRGRDLHEVFGRLGQDTDSEGRPKLGKDGKPKLLKNKYGASTTWLGKLEYRLIAGRQGGCPVLAFGITRRVIHDWKE